MGQNTLPRVIGHRKVDRVHVEHVRIDVIAELINLLGLLIERPQLVVAPPADQNGLALPLILQNVVAAAANENRVDRRAIGVAHNVAD